MCVFPSLFFAHFFRIYGNKSWLSSGTKTKCRIEQCLSNKPVSVGIRLLLKGMPTPRAQLPCCLDSPRKHSCFNLWHAHKHLHTYAILRMRALHSACPCWSTLPPLKAYMCFLMASMKTFQRGRPLGSLDHQEGQTFMFNAPIPALIPLSHRLEV